MMKKSLVVLVLFALVAGNLFAEYNFSFYGRGVFTPLAFSAEDSSVSAATTTYDNASRPRIGFSLIANNNANTIGINAVFNWDGRLEDAASLVGENAHIWVKPLGVFSERDIGEIVKFTIGRFEINDLRGNIGAAEFAAWLTPDGSKDEDGVFTRFKAFNGFHLTLKPLDWWESPWNGLMLLGAVGSNIGGERAILNIVGWNALDVYKAGQYAIGYCLPDIGLARVQFIGNNRATFLQNYPFRRNSEVLHLAEGLSTNQDSDVVEFAFLYDGLEGLKIELGAKIPLKFTVDLPNYTYYPGIYMNYPYATGSLNGADIVHIQNPYRAVIGASYRWNDFNILGRLDMSFGGEIEHEGVRDIIYGNGFGFMITADYRLSPFRVGFDAAFNYHGFDKVKTAYREENIGERANDIATSERSDFGIAPWVALDIGGGVIKAGVAMMFPSNERWNHITPIKAGDDGWRQKYSGDPIISFPISVTYNF